MKFLMQKNTVYFLRFITCLVLCVAMNAQAQTTSLFMDGSLTAKTVSAYGNANVVAGQSKFTGPVGTFDGAGDYLVVSPSPLDASPKVFTIETWVYMSSIPANGWPIVSQSATGAASEQQLFVSGTNGGAANQNKLRFSRGTDATNAIDLIGTTTLPLNKWVHVALSCDGVTATLFVNGNLDASAALTSGWVDTAQAFYVATTLNTSAPQNQSFAKGKISDVRVTKNTPRYKNAFIPYAAQVLESAQPLDVNWSDTALVLKGEGFNGSVNFLDSSATPKAVNAVGNAKLSSTQSKFGRSSFYFDGNGSYLTTSSNNLVFGMDDFTIEFWVYSSQTSPNYPGIIYNSRLGGTTNGNFAIYNSYAGKQLINLDYYNNGWSGISGGELLANTWTHVAFVKAGTQLSVYKNGVIQTAKNVGSAVFGVPNRDYLIGYNEIDNAYFSGYIDDLRISKGIARYTTNFTPTEIPKIPIKTGDAQWNNVSFLVNANGSNAGTNFFDLSPFAQTVSPAGDVKTSTAQSKFGGSSVYFDSSGDYLSLQPSGNFQFGAGDFTVEAWVNHAAPTGGGYLNDKWIFGSFDYNPDMVFFLANDTLAPALWDGTNEIRSTIYAQPNTWTHVAFVRKSNVLKIFVNGVEGYSGNHTINFSSSAFTTMGGSASANDYNRYFNGYIDDLRITKGVARYTANFTPPTAQIEPPRFVKDPYTSRVSLLLLSGATAPDEITPYVTTTSKQTNTSAALDSITVNFSKSMEPTSITSAQFTVTDAAQKIFPVSSITRLSSTSFKLGFVPALLAGTYKVKAWQDILGANGLALDQNKNGIGGELADAFEQSIVVSTAAPSVITPTVISAGTRTGISVSWPAYVKPLNGKDIAKYRIYVSTTPYTNISQATKVLEVTSPATVANVTGLLSNTTYYVAVVAVDVDGKFTSAVTPIVAKTQDVTEQSASYAYNAAGQILTEDGPRTDVNDITTYTYDAVGNRATMTNARGHIVRYNSYDGAGHLLSMTDANGITTEFTYHERGWLLSSRIKHPSNSAMDNLTTYSYDAVGLMIGMTLPNAYQLTYEYDDARRLTAIQNAAGERIEYAVDAAGNRTQQKIKNTAGTIVYSVAQAFDELSRVMAITGNNNQNEKHQYDANDNTTAVTDGRNNKTQQTYDALNRVAKVIDPDLKETQFTYDAQDRIKTVTDARGNTTTYNYDGLGNLTSQSSPDTGITRFSYDSVGNRTTAVDARGVVVNYSYDALNRLTSVVYPAATAENITYTYDGTATNNYGVGRLSKVAIGSTSVSYRYSFLGLISQKTSVVNSLSKSVAYAYDKAGNLTSMTYPSGRIVNYTRDAAGRVQAVKTKMNSSATEQTVVSAVSYLPFGPVKNYTYGNGLTHTVSYDNDYRLTDIVLGGLMVRNYSYDAADNITKIIDGASATKTQNFTYDNLDRLTSANGTYGYQAFGYDGVGNRTGLLFDNGTSIQSDTYTYEPTSNRLTRIDKTNAGLANGIRNFTYDSAGNLVQGTADDGSAQTYTLNNANRLTTANVNTALVGTYSYNALGQRVSKTYADATKELFHYNEAGQLLAVTNAAGTSVREYIYNGATLVGYVNAGILIYVHNDHLNTPQVITAQNQSVLWMADYEPFGKVKLNTNNTIAFGARFPGQYLDSETGLYYNYFRDYDPSIGRYIESDPIGLEGVGLILMPTWMEIQ